MRSLNKLDWPKKPNYLIRHSSLKKSTSTFLSS